MHLQRGSAASIFSGYAIRLGNVEISRRNCAMPLTKHRLYIILGAVAVLLSGIAAAGNLDSTRTEISRTLDRLHAAAAKADGAAYFALFAPDAVFIGTDASERWPIAAFRNYAEARFAAGEGWTYTPRERHVTVAAIPCGCIAWFDELLDNAKYGTSRGSGVLIKTGQDWKIEQYALTFPIPNDMAAELTNRIKAFEAKQHR
jgi:hypothetical protein